MLTGCILNVNDVTTPKLPPPPRSAQNSSGFSSAEARTIEPSARTTSASSRLSMVRPPERAMCPMPPPSVSPPTPVVPMMPQGTAPPASCVAASTSFQTQPPPTRTVRAAASTSMLLIPARSMTTPSSQTPRPPPLWPPPRTAISAFCERAKPITAATSAAEVQRATRPGRRSIIAL